MVLVRSSCDSRRVITPPPSIGNDSNVVGSSCHGARELDSLQPNPGTRKWRGNVIGSGTVTVIAISSRNGYVVSTASLTGLPWILVSIDARGVRDHRQAAVGRLHPEVGDELGPALVHVGGAAAEVRLQAVEVRVRPVADVDVLALGRADHLVALLVVLVGRHVFLERRRQGVEGELLQAVAQPWIAQDGGQDFERVHRLDDRAELGPLRGAAAGQVLVAGEDAGGLAVVSVQQVEHPEDGVLVLGIAGEPIPHAAVLQAPCPC